MMKFCDLADSYNHHNQHFHHKEIQLHIVI